MPFDGIVTQCVVEELKQQVMGGRIEKVFQPEADEIVLNIRANTKNMKLVLSASPSYPRIHVTTAVKENPAAPPMFCMLLRKHIAGGKIMDVEFHDFERMISLGIEAVNEMGDLTRKTLIIEIMGKHSNIILVNEQNRIIDAIKHIDNEISSVREVMPARPYVLPPAQDKESPLMADPAVLLSQQPDSPIAVEKHLLNRIKGFSPLLCREICHTAGINAKTQVQALEAGDRQRLTAALEHVLQDIRTKTFAPGILYTSASMDKPLDFHCLKIEHTGHLYPMDSMSAVLDKFYSDRDQADRLTQKKSDVLRTLHNALDRCHKKISLQQDKLREVADRDMLQLYGELITANIYCIPRNVDKIELMNYYSETGEMIEVPLDATLLPQENAQRYFKRYAKAKSTHANTSIQLEESQKELQYLESVLLLLDNCSTLQEIDEIRQELTEQGYIKSRRKPQGKKGAKASSPHHYISSDGLDIFVGKNNRQNDSLTLRTASSNDIWLHTKEIPGSHVIIRKQQGEVPDSTLLEAATLAAYYSKARMSSTVPVDYTTVRNVKKPSGAKPGMVIYENYRTIFINPSEEKVQSMTKA